MQSRTAPALFVAVTLVVALAHVRAAPAEPATPTARKPDAAAVSKATSADSAYRELKWEELMPKDWDPSKRFRNRNTTIRSDTDPRARELLAEIRAVWDSAPTVASLDGAKIKLPGYVVPLEEVRGELKEFLLVPYFGACIHTPPPPANQIVFVVPPKGVSFRAMDTVWVSGTLHATRQDSYMGASGYRIEAASVDRYTPP